MIYKQVGTFNSTGQKFKGHDYIWLTNEIQELEITISSHYPNAASSTLQPAWVNGNLYKQTKEEIGILPLHPIILEKAGMQAYISSVDHKQKQWFIAQLQGTRKAVLPVHTIAERRLFNEFMLTCRVFYISRTELTPEAVKLWNRKAETMPGVYYKVIIIFVLAVN